MRSLPAVLGALVITLRWLVVLSAGALVLTMTTQVLLRYVLQSSFLGVEEISTLFGLWLYFAGIALVSAQDRHIRGGFVLSLLPQRHVAFVNRVFVLLCAGISIYFLVVSFEYLQFVVSMGRRSTFLRLPSYLWVASLNTGLLLSALVFLIRFLQPSREAWR